MSKIRPCISWSGKLGIPSFGFMIHGFRVKPNVWNDGTDEWGFQIKIAFFACFVIRFSIEKLHADA